MPLQAQGEGMHAALVQRLLNDSAEDPDHLPVLQHLLRRLWENWSGDGATGAIGMADYEDVGGWERALDSDAEAVLQHFAADDERIGLLFQWITERGPGERALRRPRPLVSALRSAAWTPNASTRSAKDFKNEGCFERRIG